MAAMINEKLEEELRTALAPGESLLHFQRPVRLLAFRPFDQHVFGWFIALFTMAFFITILLFGKREEVLGYIFPALFLFAFNYFGFGKYAVRAWTLRNTAYAITNQHLIIISGWRRRKVRRHRWEILTRFELVHRALQTKVISLFPREYNWCRLGQLSGEDAMFPLFHYEWDEVVGLADPDEFLRLMQARVLAMSDIA